MAKFLFFTLVLPVLWAGMAACQGTGATQEPDGEADAAPEAATPGETPGVGETEVLPSGLSGQVIAASDVSGQPDEPLTDQMIVAIPSEIAGEILGPGSAGLTGEELRFLRVSVLQAHPAVIFTLSDAAGNYSLRLDPGEYILCLADSEKTPPDFPATTRGCGRVQVRPGELRQVDISSGFGEMLLVEP